MKINDKIKLPLDSNVGIGKLKNLVVNWKNNEIKLVNWKIINIYDSKLYQKKMVELKYRNKIILKIHSEVEEMNNYIYETFI